MTVTAIKKNRDGSFCIYCDGEPFCTLCEKVFLESEVEPGADITEERMLELAALSDAFRARTKALELVARRELCRKQLLERLREKGFDGDASREAADEMERLGFVDDSRFASMCADELFRLKCFGLRRVVYELTQRGVDRELAQDAAAELAPDPLQALDALLEGRLSRDTFSDAGLLRCRNTLARYGYEAADISAAIRRLLAERGE